MIKKCVRCKLDKPTSNFTKDKNKRDGLNKYCRECVSEIYIENKDKIRKKQREYYQKNKNTFRDRHKEWVSKNLDHVRSYRKRYYEKHREDAIKYSSDWVKNNKSLYKQYVQNHKQGARFKIKHRESESRRRALKKSNTVGRVNYEYIMERDSFTCQICKKGPLKRNQIHIDHIIPISKSGKHSHDNLQTTCAPCNLRKKDKIY